MKHKVPPKRLVTANSTSDLADFTDFKTIHPVVCRNITNEMIKATIFNTATRFDLARPKHVATHFIHYLTNFIQTDDW
jgi:hypothetical protein